jgi:hypothetical protein
VRKISLLSVAVLFAFCLATSLARADTLGAPTTVRHHLAQSLAAEQVPLSNMGTGLLAIALFLRKRLAANSV